MVFRSSTANSTIHKIFESNSLDVLPTILRPRQLTSPASPPVDCYRPQSPFIIYYSDRMIGVNAMIEGYYLPYKNTTQTLLRSLRKTPTPNVGFCRLCLKRLKERITLHETSPITELRGVTCHMGSHGHTYHPTQLNTPRLNPSHSAGTRFTYPGGTEG